MSSLRKLYITDPTTGARLELDDSTSAMAVLSYVHHEVHEGHAYIADIHDNDMANNDYIAIAFQTGR